MTIQTLFCFITNNNTDSLIFFTGDNNYLRNNVLHGTEFYPKMEFTFEGRKFKIESLAWSYSLGDFEFNSVDDHELYRGESASTNFTLILIV